MATRPTGTGGNLTGGRLALVAVGVLVLLLALLWFFVLRSDPAVETTTPPIPAPGAASPTPEAEPEETTRARNRPVETFEVFAPKDPFRPVLAATDTTGAGGTTGDTGDGTATGGSGTTNGDGTGTTAGGGSQSGGGSSGGESIGGRRVRLVDVFSEDGDQRARVQVDGTVYTVREGDRFADNFELLDIQGQCASLLYGDDQFTLCEGEEILK